MDEFDISGIAQYSSDLSQEGHLPAGAGPAKPSGPFLPDDVDFESNDWRMRSLAVQGWMGLDDTVDMQLPFSASATRLMETISPDPPETCPVRSEEKVTLTDIGAQHLPTTSPSLIAFTETQVPFLGANLIGSRRYMTPAECACLGGIQLPPSGLAAYKALGNAVNARVVKAIAERLLYGLIRPTSRITSDLEPLGATA